MTATRMGDAFVITGIQLELEEQARLLELLLGVAHTAKTAYTAYQVLV